MFKKKLLKRLTIIMSCLLVVEILYLFPKNKDDYLSIVNNYPGVIYLLDNNNYVSLIDINYKSKSPNKQIREIINILTINSLDSIKIKEGFKGIIPENTKLLNSNINNNTANLNFSKDILAISEELEEKMISAIVYSITALDGINKVTIKVENNILSNLPNSKKELPTYLDRTFKINKEYNISSIEGINSTTVYYPASINNFTYYVPVSKYSNNKKEKIEIIISELKSSSTYNTNLINYINENTKLINYELLDKSMILNFNESILSDINSNNITEEVSYAISLSVKDTYNLDNIIYYVNNKIVQ